MWRRAFPKYIPPHPNRQIPSAVPAIEFPEDVRDGKRQVMLVGKEGLQNPRVPRIRLLLVDYWNKWGLSHPHASFTVLTASWRRRWVVETEQEEKEWKYSARKVFLCSKDRNVGQTPCCLGWVPPSDKQLLLRTLGAPLVINADSSPVKINISPYACEFPNLSCTWKPGYTDCQRKAGLPFFGMKQSLHSWKSGNTLH